MNHPLEIRSLGLLLAVALTGIVPARAATAVSPDGRYQVDSLPEPGVVLIHDLNYERGGGHSVLRMEALTEPVQTIAFSPDGRQLETRGSNGQLRLWKVLPGGALEPATPSR
jgi:WD40 repeat protein